MPPVLNAVATQNTYVTALTVTFTVPRKSFSLNVLNASIMYRLYYIQRGIDTRDGNREAYEHLLPPSFSRFSDPPAEGLPSDALFAGVEIRSAVAGAPALVTVI